MNGSMGPVSLLGAHRTGKTTLAAAFAQRHDIPFVKTGTTEIFAALGKDPKIDYPIEERMAIQEAILYGIERQYQAARSRYPTFIADRSPLDLASYLIADIQRATLAGEPELADMVVDYVRRCIESTNHWFATVVLVQPGIELVEASGKASACPAFIEHLNLIQSGLLLDSRLIAKHYIIPRKYTNLDDRVEAVGGAVLHATEAHVEFHRKREAAGIFLH